jgi:hypothetical protein
VSAGIIVALLEGVPVNRVSLDATHLGCAFYDAVEADEAALFNAIIRDITVAFASNDLSKIPHLLLLEAMVQCTAELEAGLAFDRSDFNRNVLSSTKRSAKELVVENWDAVATLAEMLLRQPVVNRTDLDSILGSKP